ncbi:MAG: peptide chain release factor N(5)-glutamine methyltransferase [Pleurocapsa sp.]
MKVAVSGQELALWRKQALDSAIASKISIQEVDWLLREVTELDNLSLRLESFKNSSQIILSKSLEELSQLWQQRLQEHLPVQYLLNTVYWRNFKLKVTSAVLIPRPETELIIDIALQAAQNQQLTITEEHWADLGTGSGAIALGLATSMPQATIHAVDYSPQALNVAQENALNLGLQERINFYQGNWWSPLDSLRGKVRGMISNPPYIPSAEVLQLQPEVTRHEPHLALDGGKDGLDDIRHLVEVAPDYLISGGIWLIEMMAGQSQTVKQLLENQGEYEEITIFFDLAGIERFALAYRR